MKRFFLQSPARVSVLAFLVIILLGTILLRLPAATPGPRIGWIDALFTATSATCVTGLVVLDTGNFSRYGQLVILGLIQVGGLGIMTLSTLFLLLAGRRTGLMGRVIIQDTFTHRQDRRPAEIIREVILLALVIEAIGIAGLFICFLPQTDYQWSEAFYSALFHAISAFCNAGFSLYPDSLIRFKESLPINLIFSGLIISGGLGFLVMAELIVTKPTSRRAFSRLSLHSKLSLTATGILLLAGTLIFLILEWNNTLAPFSIPGRFIGAFFQSVTTRTAGFNTVPIGDLTNVTLFFIIMLMFVGACPGSCAGGIKTTTAGVIFMMGFSRFLGWNRPSLFYRTISDESAGRAVSLVIIANLVIIAGTALLLITELGETPHPESRGKFLELLFEMVSAFGTVGLSTGITNGLSELGRLGVTLVMFIGRLGPLVIAIAISRHRTSARFYYAEENVMIG